MKKIRKKELCRRGLALLLSMTMLFGMSHIVFAEDLIESDGAIESLSTEEPTFTEQQPTKDGGDEDTAEICINTIVILESKTIDDEKPVGDIIAVSLSEDVDGTNKPESDPDGADEAEVMGESEHDVAPLLESNVAGNSDDFSNTEKAENTDEPFDLTKTDRPKQDDDIITTAPGSYENENPKWVDSKEESDWNWEIFYDADRDVYKVTFKIDEGVDVPEVVFDLTRALKLLGKYVETGRQELEDAKNALDRLVMDDVGEEPVEPETPKAFDKEKPIEPEEPKSLDEKTSTAFDAFAKMAALDPAASTVDNAMKYLAAQDLEGDDSYLIEYANYMMNSADLKQAVSDWNYFVETGHWYVSYFGDLDTFLFYGCGIEVKWNDEGEPYLPKPTVNENSDFYKDEKAKYDSLMNQYAEDLMAYNADKAAYDAALNEWMEKQDSEQEEYQNRLKEYLIAKKNYDDKKAEIEKKFSEDKAAYDVAIKALEDEYNRRIGANVLEPGDIRKFEIWLTSDSKHTYKYKSGSFTLATPDFSELTKDPANASGVTGFDGQELPNKNGNQNFGYVDTASYNVSQKSKAVIELMRQSFAFTGETLYDSIFKEYDECLKKYEETGDPKELTLGMFTGMNSTDISRDVSLYLNSLYEDEGTSEEKLNRYLVEYYNKKLGLNCETVDELLEADPDLIYDISGTNTDANRDLELGNGPIKVGSHTQDLRYSNFYKNLFSFAYGDEADIDAITGELLNSNGDYANPSWTTNGAKNALYYYMAHQEIWKKTDNYFRQLLDGGLTAEQATWSTFMMALNIDGVATGNNWQDTMWPWYNSIQLEQQDGKFKLTKADADTNDTITASETKFQLWRIDKEIVDEETGETREVKMYCSYDKKDNTYSFTNVESILETTDGQLDILYTLMKDTVYYLQEYEAPEGYVKNPRVYVIMDESKFSMDECIEANNNATKNEGKSVDGLTYAYLGSISSEKPLEVVFVNAKITTPPPTPTPTPGVTPTPTPTPEVTPPPTPTPTPGVTPPPTPTPTPGVTPPPTVPDIPDDPVPFTDIPEPPVPLAERPVTVELPDEDVPLAGAPELVDIFDEDVPLAAVPETGDISVLWYVLVFSSAAGLLALRVADSKKRKIH